MKRDKSRERFFNMKLSNDGTEGEVWIYGEITKWAWEEDGEVSSISFKNELDELGDVEVINLFIHSAGGSVFEGLAIYNMLKRHEARVIVHVDAVAASIASVIAMAGDEIRMPANSLMMIHNAWTWTMGNADALRKAADDLDRINQSSVQTYLQKAGDKLDEDTLKQLLDDETWLSAEDALNYGLCDVVLEENNMAASISEDFTKMYKNIPDHLVKPKQSNGISDEKRKQIAEQALSNANYIDELLGGIRSEERRVGKECS